MAEHKYIYACSDDGGCLGFRFRCLILFYFIDGRARGGLRPRVGQVDAKIS